MAVPRKVLNTMPLIQNHDQRKVKAENAYAADRD